jgi:hypothetical protein
MINLVIRSFTIENPFSRWFRPLSPFYPPDPPQPPKRRLFFVISLPSLLFGSFKTIPQLEQTSTFPTTTFIVQTQKNLAREIIKELVSLATRTKKQEAIIGGCFFNGQF